MRLIPSILGALALACLPWLTFAQTAAQLAVKDAAGTTRNLCETADVSGNLTPCLQAGAATAANQATEITAEQAQATAAGAPADTAYTSGSGSMIALLKAQLAALQTPTAAPTASNFLFGQGSVTTTAARLIASRTGRRSVTVENTGATPVYLGGSGVTSTTGFLLPGVAGASLTINFTGALYAVTASGTAAVTFYELY